MKVVKTKRIAVTLLFELEESVPAQSFPHTIIGLMANHQLPRGRVMVIDSHFEEAAPEPMELN